MKVRAIAAGSLFLLAAAASAKTTSHDPKTLIALEHRWIAAIQAHDVGTLDKLLTDDFIDSTYRGAVRTKADVLAGPSSAGPYRSVGLEGLEVRYYGTTGVVTGVNVLRKRDSQVVVRVRFTDVFVRKHGAWRAVSAQETLVATS